MTKMVIMFLMETFHACSCVCDEDVYNVHLGNIHCLFMNALMMMVVTMFILETFIACLWTLSQWSRLPEPLGIRSSLAILFQHQRRYRQANHLHCTVYIKTLLLHKEWYSRILYWEILWWFFYPSAAPLSCLSQQSRGSPGRIISHKKRPFWCQCPILNGWVQAKIRNLKNGYILYHPIFAKRLRDFCVSTWGRQLAKHIQEMVF